MATPSTQARRPYPVPGYPGRRAKYPGTVYPGTRGDNCASTRVHCTRVPEVTTAVLYGSVLEGILVVPGTTTGSYSIIKCCHGAWTQA
eukprot:2230176-Rhodomonas_salina.6